MSPQHEGWVAIEKRVRHWYEQSLEKVVSLTATPPNSPDTKTRRRSYRKEVRAWMKRKEISSVRVAASRLAVSESILKSIMADHGKIKYGAATLKSVREKIGLKDGD
jgi:hypothetical protein